LTDGRESAEYVPERFWAERYRSLDLTRSGHRDLPEAYNRWLYRRKRAVLRRALAAERVHLAGARVLELGVGTGAYLPMWRRLGARVIGIDLSEAAAACARERHPECEILVDDVTAPGLAARCPGPCDLVAALDVLYHVVDDAKLAQALANAAQLLRPGGWLVLHDQFLHRPSESHGYIRWRSLEDWQALLAAAGFQVVARVPIFFGMIRPTDWRSPGVAARMDAVWDRTETLIHRAPALAGALAFAVDSVLGRLLREGPSMELLLARRAPGPAP